MLLPKEIKIYLYAEPADMRKSIDTLLILVADVLGKNPASGDLFLFRNKQCNKLKTRYYEQNCFTLWYGYEDIIEILTILKLYIGVPKIINVMDPITLAFVNYDNHVESQK